MRLPFDFIKKIMWIFVVLIPTYFVTNFLGVFENKYVSFVLFCFFIFFLRIYKEIDWKNKRRNITIGTLSVIYSICYVFGSTINETQQLFLTPLFVNPIYQLVVIYSFAILFFMLLSRALELLETMQLTNTKKATLKTFFLIFLILLICWLPYFISYYPGLMSIDSTFQWCQAMGECALTNHHPVAHTMFIKPFAMIGVKLNNPNLGVALYSLTQTLIMASGFAYILYSLLKRNMPKIGIGILTLYFAITPIFGYYSITMWKDVLFGLFVGILMLQLYKFVEDKKLSIPDKIITAISVMLVTIFRSNGKYITIVLVLFIAILYRKQLKNVAIIYILPLFLSLILVGPVYSLLNIKGSNFVENVGIPLKQIASTVKLNLHIDKQDLDRIEKIVPIKTIKKEYDPNAADALKFSDDFDNDYLNNHKGVFFQIWWKYLKQYPKNYVETYLRSTYGFWYPETQGYITHRWPIEKNKYNDTLVSTDKFDSLQLESYFNGFYNMPIVKYLTSDAFCFYLLLFTIAITIYKKKKQYLLVLLVPLLVWGTIMVASPIAYQPRYTFALYCCVPMMVKIIFELYRKKKRSTS